MRRGTSAASPRRAAGGDRLGFGAPAAVESGDRAVSRVAHRAVELAAVDLRHPLRVARPFADGRAPRQAPRRALGHRLPTDGAAAARAPRVPLLERAPLVDERARAVGAPPHARAPLSVGDGDVPRAHRDRAPVHLRDARRRRRRRARARPRREPADRARLARPPPAALGEERRRRRPQRRPPPLAEHRQRAVDEDEAAREAVGVGEGGQLVEIGEGLLGGRRRRCGPAASRAAAPARRRPVRRRRRFRRRLGRRRRRRRLPALLALPQFFADDVTKERAL